MVLEKVKAILAEQFDVDEDKITVDTDLQEDLGADSLDVVDLLMSIEDEFEVEVPDEEIENIKTVGAGQPALFFYPFRHNVGEFFRKPLDKPIISV